MIARFCTGLTAALLMSGTALADVRVVASIPPVHSLVASVMEGVGAPELLVPANVSEHDYALKPSDARKIAQADVVFWVGDALEAYLAAPLKSSGGRNIALIDVPGVDAHPFRQPEDAEEEHTAHEGAADAEHGHEGEDAHADEHADAHHHEHTGLDPHVWMDPVRAQAMVEAIAKALAEQDSANAEIYRANAARSVEALKALNAETASRLKPYADRPFVTFHEGYSYFVERYGLDQVGQVTVDPQRRPGAASVKALRDAVGAKRVVCAFAEPQYDEAAITALAGGTGIKIGGLDTLGAGIEPGPSLYPELIRHNAAAVEACLAPTS
jgi:zinc transport system substrate-binding protein